MGDLEPMLREAEIRFNVQDANYKNPTKKAYYVLFLFKTGNAKLWKEQYIRQREGRNLCEGDLWTEFTRTLKEAFRDVGSQDDTIYKLHNTRQGDSTVDEFNTKFRINVQMARLDEQENATLLIAAYSRNLDARIGEAIIMQGAPTTLSEWMFKASTIDGYGRRAQMYYHPKASYYNPKTSRGRGTTTNSKPQWKPKEYRPKENYGEPMEIDRLTPQQNKEYREKGLCFVCGEKGHMANEHKGGQSNNGQEDRRNTPGQQPFRGLARGRGQGRGQRGGPSRIRTTHQQRDEVESAKDKAESTRTAI